MREGTQERAAVEDGSEVGRDFRALFAVIDGTRALFHRLKAAAEQLHRSAGITAGQRAVLMDLSKSGAQTVPQMARSRPVSRQHIQSLVNPLRAEALVELVDNPAHKRSRLVQLTGEGKAVVAGVQQRERQILLDLPHGFSTEELETAAKVISGLRNYFLSADWRDRLAAVAGGDDSTT